MGEINCQFIKRNNHGYVTFSHLGSLILQTSINESYEVLERARALSDLSLLEGREFIFLTLTSAWQVRTDNEGSFSYDFRAIEKQFYSFFVGLRNYFNIRYIYTLELQKNLTPHVHAIIFLKEEEEEGKTLESFHKYIRERVGFGRTELVTFYDYGNDDNYKFRKEKRNSPDKRGFYIDKDLTEEEFKTGNFVLYRQFVVEEGDDINVTHEKVVNYVAKYITKQVDYSNSGDFGKVKITDFAKLSPDELQNEIERIKAEQEENRVTNIGDVLRRVELGLNVGIYEHVLIFKSLKIKRFRFSNLDFNKDLYFRNKRFFSMLGISFVKFVRLVRSGGIQIIDVRNDEKYSHKMERLTKSQKDRFGYIISLNYELDGKRFIADIPLFEIRKNLEVFDGESILHGVANSYGLELGELDDLTVEAGLIDYCILQNIDEEIKSILSALAVDKHLTSYGSKYNFIKPIPELTLTQNGFIRVLKDNNFIHLHGGAGTGKTTTVKAISRMFLENGKKVVVLTPTGRAAENYQDIQHSNFIAKTGHSYIKSTNIKGNFFPAILPIEQKQKERYKEYFSKNIENPYFIERLSIIIEEDVNNIIDCVDGTNPDKYREYCNRYIDAMLEKDEIKIGGDLLIVDEVYLFDKKNFYGLLQIMYRFDKIVFVGDISQIDNLDIDLSYYVDTYTLREVKRQREDFILEEVDEFEYDEDYVYLFDSRAVLVDYLRQYEPDIYKEGLPRLCQNNHYKYSSDMRLVYIPNGTEAKFVKKLDNEMVMIEIRGEHFFYTVGDYRRLFISARFLTVQKAQGREFEKVFYVKSLNSNTGRAEKNHYVAITRGKQISRVFDLNKKRQEKKAV